MALEGRDCAIKTDFGEWDGWDGGVFEAWGRAEGRKSQIGGGLIGQPQ